MAESETPVKKLELVLIPAPGHGHVIPLLEFARRLADHDAGVSITVLCIEVPLNPVSGSFIKSIMPSQSQIKLIDVPKIDPPPQELLIKSAEYFFSVFMESLKPVVKSTIQNIFSASSSSADSNPSVVLVFDFYCMPMVDVGKELGIPSYMFLTTNAGFLSTMLSLQKRQIDQVFSKSGPDLMLPGFQNPVPPRHLPDALFSKFGGYSTYYKLAQRLTDTNGIIVNTFPELEQYAIDALSEDDHTPPIYTVGPLIDAIAHPNPNSDQAEQDMIIEWLDDQPPSSVVFLCFGSLGSFCPSQTKEIAKALQRSGVRFLWAMLSPQSEEHLEMTMPEGFLEWMKDKGMLCGWAPQVDILAHEAIGGFVSHCGWNSILESLWFGVPILTLPIYAEQQLNAFRMVREFGIAVELRLDYRSWRTDVIMADEIETGIAHLMNRDSFVYKKVQEMKQKARNTGLSGGSSFISTGRLIEDMRNSSSN